MADTRPSYRELTKKLREAQKILASDGYLPVDPVKLAGDFAELSLYSTKEQLDGLKAALSEVTARQYRGKHPPDQSFEAVVKGREIFLFIWDSAYFRRRMYLKFCFQESVDFEETHLYVFSMHPNQPERRKKRK